MALKEIKSKSFANGMVYALETEDGYPIETTDTFLPYYTKDAIGRKQNALTNKDVGSRNERWMIGVSTMSGCPVGCKFCATGKLKRCRNLTAGEIIEQVLFIMDKNEIHPIEAQEFKINYTRMGEPFLNIENVKMAIRTITAINPFTHHYISTIGIKGSDFSWIKENTTLQFSIHSFDSEYRNWLIPYKNKMSLEEIGNVRTKSHLKTTLNLTMVREEDWNINELLRCFDKRHFFIKISPINKNEISEMNEMGDGIIKESSLV